MKQLYCGKKLSLMNITDVVNWHLEGNVKIRKKKAKHKGQSYGLTDLD